MRLPESVSETLRREAGKAYPRECCGVLLGRVEAEVRTVTAALACRNQLADAAADRYRIDPRELIAAQRRARAQGEEIVGFYHSHPDSPAVPSASDRAEAYWPEACYVIVSLVAGRAPELRAYRPNGQTSEKWQEEEVGYILDGAGD